MPPDADGGREVVGEALAVALAVALCGGVDETGHLSATNNMPQTKHLMVMLILNQMNLIGMNIHLLRLKHYS